MVPKDPVILLSFVNTKLRDEEIDLEDFCKKYEVDKVWLMDTLSSINYSYNKTLNKFA